MTALLAILLTVAVALPAAAAAPAAPARAPRTGAPVTAVTLPLPVPVLNCTTALDHDRFQAVFGYVNNGPEIVVPAGLFNAVYPADGSQPTVFRHGTHQAALVTGPTPKNRKASWQLLGVWSVAGWKQSPCGPDVTLPTEGNGIGPVLVLVLSVLASTGIGALRGRRRRRRST